MLISANDAIRLRLQCDSASLASIVPFAALPVDFVAVLVVLNVLPALADHDLISSSRLNKFERDRIGR